MDENSKIYIAGHTGLVGSSILRYLNEKNYGNIITATRKKLDLTKEKEVRKFFKHNKPEYVILSAAKVGGIKANNSYPVDFIMDNLAIEYNIIKYSYEYGVKKLLFLGSSCIYPRDSEQPIREEYLMSGKLEPTNSAYSMAKIAGIEMCKSYNKQYNTNYICAMPTNMYGPFDNYDLNNSHVLPALIRKFHDAKVNNDKYVKLWGDGNAMREFLYIDDMAEAAIFLLNNYNASLDDNLINVGYGYDITIKELANIIRAIIEYNGDIIWDNTMNGMPKKLLNSSKINELGWQPKIKLLDGIKKTYDWYKTKF